MAQDMEYVDVVTDDLDAAGPSVQAGEKGVNPMSCSIPSGICIRTWLMPRKIPFCITSTGGGGMAARQRHYFKPQTTSPAIRYASTAARHPLPII